MPDFSISINADASPLKAAVETAKRGLESLAKIDLAELSTKLEAASKKIAALGSGLSRVGDFFTKHLTGPLTIGLGVITKELDAKLKTLNDKVKVLFSKLFEPVIPILTRAVDYIIGIVDKLIALFDSAPRGVRVFIIVLASIAVAIGPVITAVGSAVTAISGFVAAIGTIVAGGAMSVVIGAIAAAIALLVAGIGIAIGVIYALHEAWNTRWGAIASVVAIAAALIITAISPILGLPILLGAVAATIYEMWLHNFGGLQDLTAQVWAKIKEYIQIALTGIEALVNDIGGRIVAWWNENYPLIEQTIKTVSDAIEAYIRTFLGVINAFWTAHGESIMTVVSTAWMAIKATITFVVEQLMSFIKLGMQIINRDWSGAWQTFLGIVQNTVSKVVQAWRWMQDMTLRAMVAMGRQMQEMGTRMMTGFLTAIRNGFVWLVNKFWQLPGLLLSIVPALYNAGVSIAQAIWNGIKNGFSFSEGGGGGGSTSGPPVNPGQIFSFEGIFNDVKNFFNGLGNSVEGVGAAAKSTTLDTNNLGSAIRNTGRSSREASKNVSGVTDNRVATVVNDELMKLGWTPNARLSMLGNIGRENAWNMNTIFSGHNDPANNKQNLGIISWQGNRRERMLEYMRGQGLLGKGGKVMQNDESLRAMVRFMNQEMQTGKWGNQSDLVKDEGASLGEISRSFQQYILYSRKRPYNTPDAEFDVRNNRTWAERAQGLIDSTSAKSLGGDAKTLEQLADQKIYQAAAERVQKMVQLSRELNVALTVPTEVATSNQDLILKQEVELRNLTELKNKRVEVRDTYIELLPLLQQVGKTADDYQTGTIEQARESAARLKAVKDSQALVNSEYDKAKKKLEELESTTTVAKTPLQEFTAEWQRLQKASGLTEEEFRKLHPTLAETEAMLKKIAAIELGKKLDAEAKTVIKAIEGITAGLRQELDKLNGVKANPFVDFIREIGKIKELKLYEGKIQELIDLCVSTNGIDVEKFKTMVGGWLKVLAAFGLFDKGKIDETVKALGAAAAAQNTLTGSEKQNAVDSIEKDLKKQLDALRGVNPELTTYQKTLDTINQMYPDMDQGEKTRLTNMAKMVDRQKELNEGYTKFKDFVSESLNTLMNEGFGGLFKSIVNKFKKMLIDMAAEWISSQIYKLIFKEGGKGFGEMIKKALHVLGIAGGNKNGTSVATPGGGGGGNGDPKRQGDAGSVAQTGADAAGGGLFDPVRNPITGDTSKLAGKMSGIGALMTLAGGLIGGRVGGIISMAGTGMSIGAMFGPWGAAIGAVAGGLIGLFMGDPKKKIDKKENMPKLQKGFTDAMQQLRDLLSDRNQIFSDPDGAIQRAMDIRGQIASGFGIEFQSKKYKKIAQQQIAAKLIEADQVIKQIKEMADLARMAGKVDSRLEAEFATGVYADAAFIRQHADFKRRNGMLPGGWTGRDTLPSMLAPGEMVLNPKQIARVKFNAGFDAFKGAGIPNYATGGFIGNAPSSTPVSPALQPVTVQIVVANSGMVESDIKGVLVNGLKSSDVQVELVKAYDKGKTRTR